MKKSIIIALLVANILGVLSPFLASNISRAYAEDTTAVDPSEAAREAARMAAQAQQSTTPLTPASSIGDAPAGADFESGFMSGAVNGPNNNNPAKPEETACSSAELGSPSTWPGAFVCYIIRITLLKMAIAGLYVTSSAFDYVVNISLFDVNKAMRESSIIYNLWSFVRSACNLIALFLFFIALFLYSISDRKIEFSKYLVKVLIFAVFINFSYPISKAIIDVSNVAALNIYGGITNYKFRDNAHIGRVLDDYGLSYELMQVLGIQNPIAASGDIEKSKKVIEGVDGVTTILGLVMLVCAMAVVFAQAFMLFATRMAMIFLCIITSPIMFMGGILPPNPVFNIDDWVERWLKAFFGSAFFAPILMIAIGLAIELMKFTMSLGKGTTGLGVTDSLLQLILMVICIVIFQKSVEYSATLMDGVGQRAAAIGARIGGKMMSTGIARPAAAITRNTFGRAASRVFGQNDEKWLNKVKGGGGISGGLASGALKGLESIRALKPIQSLNSSIRNSSMDVMGRGTALMSLGTVNNIRANQGSLVRDDERIENFKNRKAEKEEKARAAKAKSGAEEASKKASERSEMANTYDNITEMFGEDLEKIKTESAAEMQKIKDELDTIKKRANLIETGKVRDRDNNITSEKLQTLRNMRQTLKREMDEAVARGDTVTADGKRKQLEQTNQVYEEYREQIGLKELERGESDAKNRLDDLGKRTAAEITETEEAIVDSKRIAEEERAGSVEAYNKSNMLGAEAETRNENAGTLKAAREAYKAKYKAGDDAENAVNSLSPRAIAEMSAAVGAGNDAARAANKARNEAEYKAKVEKETAKNMKAFMATLEKNSHAAAQASNPRPATTPKPATATTPKTGSTPATTASTSGAGH